MEVSKKRKSNVELLRIFAMFLIILSHSIPYWSYGNMEGYINIRNAANNYKEFLIIIMKYLGQMGNCIFIICSSYFLLDSKKVNVKKILWIIADNFFVSIIIMYIYYYLRL